MRWVYYVLALAVTVLAVFLWYVVVVIYPASDRLHVPLSTLSSRALPVAPVLLSSSDPLGVQHLNDTVADVAREMQRSQKAQMLRLRGLTLPRPLREGERCVGGTIVRQTVVNGVPTFQQETEGLLRVSCDQTE